MTWAMKQCGRCGTQNLDEQAACTGCGEPLPGASPKLGGTLVMPGLEPATPPAAPKPNLKGTMIGMAPPTFAMPPPAAAPPPTTGSEPPPTGSQPPARHFGATMLGGMIAPSFPSPPPPPPAESLGDVPTGGANAPRIASAQKTVLGVARPGIAPLNPGQAKAAAPAAVAAAPAPIAAAPAAWVPVAPPPASTGPASPRRAPPPSRISVSAALAITGSAMLLVMAALAFFMLRGRGSVTAKASLDAKGVERLELSCAECPNGTKTWIDASPVAFQGGKATLTLQTPLKVGENPLVLVLERPGRSREEIALSIPIEFRVRGSTDKLAQDSPKVSVLADTLAGTKLVVDGKPVPADANGAVHFDYDVASALTGPEASVKLLERVVPYKATSASGATNDGKVEVRIGITPLIVDAPGASITVGEKEIVLAGRTAPGSELKIGALSVQLDPEGRFVSKQALAVGDNAFIVRSTLKDHAPRLVRVIVRRSDDLDRELSLSRAKSQTSYTEVLRLAEGAVGRSLSLEGPLFDLRHDGYSSVLLVDVKNGCKKPPCLVKLIYGVETHPDKGRTIKAFGKITRFVEGARSGERIPEMRAELVVAGAK
jgi:hypothetical protein